MWFNAHRAVRRNIIGKLPRQPSSKNERVTTILIKAKALRGYTLLSLDGEIGTVKEFYFDDQQWTIRYLVAETGDWLTDRQVLISPQALIIANKESQHLVVNLTKKQIEDSPSLDSDKPVSRQFEEAYYGYYGGETYWAGPYVWGLQPYVVTKDDAIDSAPKDKVWDPNLRSTNAVSGYDIQATDGPIGHVGDFIVDDETWTIRYLVVDTQNWWPGKKVLISPQWIERISWDNSKVFVNLLSETIKLSPEYTEEALLTRDYEAGLHQHYNRLGYWVDEQAPKK